MEILLPVFVIFLLAVTAMAVGVFLGRPPIKGSCGGLACIKKLDCDFCPYREHERENT
ncbi:(Na+)-NQR maturation NqrM [Maritalea myrionectae]|uniref:(Na+)-NQR maturation NqrM n=1 Tax=Maritalea myrionectae TaxID=454601 RepID=UPI00040E1F3A|nr:(Na+)-NQR maturation NqrM [Maritalea myrionectae]